MQKGREAAKGVGSVATTVHGALDAIFADLNATVQFATTFAAETENQTKRMREVLRRMEEVAQIADGAATGARQTSAATAQQIASLGELTSTSQQLSDAAATLAQTIRRFRASSLDSTRSGLPFSAEPFALQKKQAPGMIYLASEKITDTLGLKLVAGRGLSAAAVTPPSSDFSAAFASWAPEVLITKALAQELFPGGDALGKTLHAGLIDRAAKIVGIVEQFQGRPGSGRGSEVFTQVVLVPAIAPGPTALYMVRTEPGRRDAVMGQVDKEMEKLQGGRYISRMETLSDTAARTRARGRATAILLAVVTVFVVAVTALGIFGLAAFTVTARTKQIGTRRAIGARKYHIVRFFLVENWMITTAGVVIGCALALAVSVKLSLMFQSPRLPVYYLVGGILVTWFVGLAAVWIPARRAAAISPAVATRPV